MHEMVTTALDVLGLLAVAAGLYFAAAPHIGGAAFLPAGAMVLAGSGLAAWRHDQRPKQGRGGP